MKEQARTPSSPRSSRNSSEKSSNTHYENQIQRSTSHLITGKMSAKERNSRTIIRAKYSCLIRISHFMKVRVVCRDCIVWKVRAYTFVSCPAVLATFKEESPELLQHLEQAPMSIGRVVDWYDPPLYQGNANTVLNSDVVSGSVKPFRWHPHLSGFLVSPHDKYHEARAAHRKFQEISRRDSHELRVHLQSGDLYIWDNHQILHGREHVLKEPRTSVGQTVREQAVRAPIELANMFDSTNIRQIRCESNTPF